MTRVSRFLAVVAVILALGACADDGEPAAGPTTSSSVAPATTTTTAATPATTSTTPQASFTTTALVTSNCALVGFTPNTDDAAGSVTATGLSCAEAEAFVRVVGPSTGPLGTEPVDVEGYHCVVTATETEHLPAATYKCTNGPKTITFVRT